MSYRNHRRKQQQRKRMQRARRRALIQHRIARLAGTPDAAFAVWDAAPPIGQLKFQGIPIVTDSRVPHNTVYLSTVAP